MGMELHARKIDLVVMTGSVPFFTAGLFQEDQTDATLLSGALTGMSTMFQELLQQGELRHSELYNAHIYIRHLTQMNNSLGIINPDLIHSAQMKVAIIVRGGELSREQELSLSEFCYSLMVKICTNAHLAKKLAKGNIEGYLPSSKETIEILAEAITDFRKRAKKSLFYENPKFLQEKDRFSAFPGSDAPLEELIRAFSTWIIEAYYPPFFEEMPFRSFFGKASYWQDYQALKQSFEEHFLEPRYRERVIASLFNFILKGGLVPLLLYTGDIVKRLTNYYTHEFSAVFERFLEKILITRGPVGISLRATTRIVKKLPLSDEKLICWQFIRHYLEVIDNRPFELQFLKQLCKLLEKFEIKEPFMAAILESTDTIVPQNYREHFLSILNDHFSKPVELKELKKQLQKRKKDKSSLPPADKKAPAIPSISLAPSMGSSEKVPKKEQQQSKKQTETPLPKTTPESQLLNTRALLRAISNTFSWAHNYLFGKLTFINGSLPEIGRDGLLFYNISESLTIEIGLILNLIQSFSGPRTWLIGQLERQIDDVESKLRAFTPEAQERYEKSKPPAIDMQHVDVSFQNNAKRILAVLAAIEEAAASGKITLENKKSFLEAGFLGRMQEHSIPNARKLLVELKTLNKRLTTKELELISQATTVNFKGLTNNVTSMQFLAVPLPTKESEYPKEIRECFSRFRKWRFDLEEAVRTLFTIGLEMPNPLSPPFHREALEVYLRTALDKVINRALERTTESTKARQLFVETCYKVKREIFTQIGKRLLLNKPLKIFTGIPLFKAKEERNYLFNFTPIKVPTVSEEISKFFVVTEEDEPEVLGRIYPYQPFDEEEITNLSELIISDAFRRAYANLEKGLKKIVALGKRIHSGVPNLESLLLETYHQICSHLTITKTTN